MKRIQSDEGSDTRSNSSVGRRSVGRAAGESPTIFPDWQPIDTAPHDGTFVLLWAEAWEMSWGIQIGHFENGKWLCGEGEVGEDEIDDYLSADDEPVNIGPTHWMPLPPIPETDDELDD